MDWLFNNKEWLFNGVGVSVISGLVTIIIALFGFFFFRKDRHSIKQHGNGNVAHSGNGDINNTVNVGAISQPSYRTEVKNGIKTNYKFDPSTETESVVSTGIE